MPFWYAVNVTLHVLAAMLWLGGMFFLGAVGAPVLRTVEPPELRQRLFHTLGERFRTVGWIAIGVLLVTGTLNLQRRGWLTADLWTSPAFWSTRAGTALAIKLIAVTVMIALSAFHDFVHGPAASRLSAGSPEAVRARHHASILARINALIGVVLLVAAIYLTRG